MKTLSLALVLASLTAVSAHAGFGINDLKDKVDKSHKCDPSDQGCKNKEHLKAVAKVAAVAVAAKVITDMVVEYNTQKVSDESKVIAEYKEKYKTLPPKPVASLYTTQTLPGKVVEPGKKVKIQSEIEVVPGSQQKEALIEERISIFDNEDHSKELKNMTKQVNAQTKRGGRYKNEFSFQLPEGLPQGVYPIKTALLIDGQSAKTADNDIQLVLQVNPAGQMQVLALAGN
jgi:hypothetical protein